MKSILLTLIFFAYSYVFSQKDVRFNLFYGKNAANFLYQDGLSRSPTQFVLGDYYALSIGIKATPRQTFRPEINFYQAGAKSSFNGVPLNWKLNYIGAGFAYLVKIVGKDSALFNLSTGAFLSLDYLTSGNQSIGFDNYDVVKENIFEKYTITSSFLLNGTYKVTDLLFLNFEYRFNFGLKNIEKDIHETTKNIGNTGSIGISFKL